MVYGVGRLILAEPVGWCAYVRVLRPFCVYMCVLATSLSTFPAKPASLCLLCPAMLFLFNFFSDSSLPSLPLLSLTLPSAHYLLPLPLPEPLSSILPPFLPHPPDMTYIRRRPVSWAGSRSHPTTLPLPFVPSLHSLSLHRNAISNPSLFLNPFSYGLVISHTCLFP